jgi:hypothetical protein
MRGPGSRGRVVRSGSACIPPVSHPRPCGRPPGRSRRRRGQPGPRRPGRRAPARRHAVGMQPGGGRGAALGRDSGTPALVEMADGDAVFLAGLAEGVLDLQEEFRQPGRRDDDRHCLTQGVERQGGHRDQRLICGGAPAVIPSVFSRIQQQDNWAELHLSSRQWVDRSGRPDHHWPVLPADRGRRAPPRGSPYSIAWALYGSSSHCRRS